MSDQLRHTAAAEAVVLGGASDCRLDDARWLRAKASDDADSTTSSTSVALAEVTDP